MHFEKIRLIRFLNNKIKKKPNNPQNESSESPSAKTLKYSSNNSLFKADPQSKIVPLNKNHFLEIRSKQIK